MLIGAGGACNDDHDEAAWHDDDEESQDDEEVVAAWVGGSRAEGATEALESDSQRKAAKVSRRGK